MIFFCVAIILFADATFAATYTVKPSGGDYTTISGCAAVAVAGDTCDVYTGSYAGWTQSTNGSSGNRITFTVHAGETATVTSVITLTNCQYITINGFRMEHATGRGVYMADGAVSTSDITLSNNTIISGPTTNSECFYAFGDRTLIDSNDCSGGGGDFSLIGGTNVVARNNYFHDIDASQTAEHIDFFQRVGGGTVPALTFSLIENNTEKNCRDASGQCHFLIVRTGASAAADTIIVRRNYVYSIDGSGGSYGGVGDTAPNGRFYHNTIATEWPETTNGACVSWQNAADGKAVNNICYNTMEGPWSPTIGNAFGAGNIAYTTGYSSTWNSTYSAESTYATLRNVDPLFANYPSTAALQSISPAVDAGEPLTTVAVADTGSGTSLVVDDAHFFQPGWAGIGADWLRIGSSTYVQIASIDYSTNVITLANTVTRADGDNVYLYKDSNGRIILSGEPDIGAVEYTPTGGSTGGSLDVLTPIDPTFLYRVGDIRR